MYKNEHVTRRYREGFKLKILAELSTGKYSKRQLSRIYGLQSSTVNEIEGTYRTVANNKMGIADSTGTVIVPAIYDFTFGFEQGLALANSGERSVCVDPTNPNCEYHTWEGGKWGVFNRAGKLILPIEYDYIYDHKTGKNFLQKGKQIRALSEGKITQKK